MSILACKASQIIACEAHSTTVIMSVFVFLSVCWLISAKTKIIIFRSMIASSNSNMHSDQSVTGLVLCYQFSRTQGKKSGPGEVKDWAPIMAAIFKFVIWNPRILIEQKRLSGNDYFVNSGCLFVIFLIWIANRHEQWIFGIASAGSP